MSNKSNDVESSQCSETGHSSLYELQTRAHQQALEKGWWDTWEGIDPNLAEKLMLVVSEVSEAVEELRVDKDMASLRRVRISISSTPPGKPEGFAVEIADAVIRLMDIASYVGIDLDPIINQKMRYNALRPVRHGKVF